MNPSDIRSALVQLEAEEREISQRRQGLHRQIDQVYLDAPLGAEGIALLDRLESLEGRVSSDRRLLHVRIDELRAQIGQAPGPPIRNVAAA